MYITNEDQVQEIEVHNSVRVCVRACLGVLVFGCVSYDFRHRSQNIRLVLCGCVCFKQLRMQLLINQCSTLLLLSWPLCPASLSQLEQQ